MVSPDDHLRRFEAPQPAEWVLKLRTDEPVLATVTYIESGNVIDEDAREVDHVVRTWAGKLYVAVCPTEQRTWTVELRCHTWPTPGGRDEWQTHTELDGDEVTVDAKEVLYVNLREGGTSTVGIDPI